MDALRTATSEVPSSSLEEVRGWICLPRTGDAVPRGCLGSVLWEMLSVLPESSSVALSWEAVL